MGTGNLHIGALGGGGSKLAARQQQRCPRTPRLVVVQLLVLVAAAIATDSAYPASRHTHALTHRRNSTEAEDRKHDTVSDPKRSKVLRQSDRTARPAARPTVSLPPELAAAKQAIELTRRGEWKDQTALAATVKSPVARKVVEWTLLRRSDSAAGFQRYVAFVRANPDWPSLPLLRRRAERSNATAQRCAALSARNRVARLAGLRSHGC